MDQTKTVKYIFPRPPPERSDQAEKESTIVEAVVAQDIEDELEEARLRGRQEALNQVTARTIRGDIAVVVSPEDDDDGSSHSVDESEDRKNKSIVCRYVALCVVLVLALGVTATLLLFGGEKDSQIQLEEWDEDSNAKVIIVYTPPTKQECEAIVNGTALIDEQTLIERSFDIHIDITLASESDFGPLFTAMLRHIQEKLIPIMAGCGAIDFFDTTIALADGLKNATSSVVGGKIDTESDESCDGTDDANGNCRSYILILDLYLNEEQSSASLLEVIGNAVNGDELSSALGSTYPVQTASVSLIIPSESLIDATMAPVGSDVVTVVPTQSPVFVSIPMPFSTPHPIPNKKDYSCSKLYVRRVDNPHNRTDTYSDKSSYEEANSFSDTATSRRSNTTANAIPNPRTERITVNKSNKQPHYVTIIGTDIYSFFSALYAAVGSTKSVTFDFGTFPFSVGPTFFATFGRTFSAATMLSKQC
ncbi:MAG: hypothetical protein SGBAC_003385 [Bacillariaceae sp.]